MIFSLVAQVSFLWATYDFFSHTLAMLLGCGINTKPRGLELASNFSVYAKNLLLNPGASYETPSSVFVDYTGRLMYPKTKFML